MNTALAVYGTDGTRLAGPTPFNQFFGLRPEIVRSSPPVFGDFTSDPKCYFDADLQRFFITILQLDVDPSTGNFTGPTHLFVAVSSSADPTGSFRVFVLVPGDRATVRTASRAFGVSVTAPHSRRGGAVAGVR